MRNLANKTQRILFALAISMLLVQANVNAKEGDPVAIVSHPGGVVQIETMWNLSVSLSYLGAIPKDVPVVGDLNKQAPLDYVLDRKVNQAHPTWTPAEEVKAPSRNAVKKIKFYEGTLIKVDGVKIAWIPKSISIDAKSRELLTECDALIVDNSKDTEAALKLANDVKAKLLILTTESDKGETVAGNTIAVSSKSDSGEMKVLTLLPKPIDLNDELAALMKRKEAACTASQKVFAPLTVKQLNFRPSNGSHTPRWNAEHMMGRELLFFSQIFHQKDPAIPVMDLNPKQMPPDYKAKHPDWNGMEEAMQMQRVSAFTRRFAYLLNDLPLDRKAPGSGWTPKRLLLQMERHYNEHTANVKKKFQLPDWPKE